MEIGPKGGGKSIMSNRKAWVVGMMVLAAWSFPVWADESTAKGGAGTQAPSAAAVASAQDFERGPFWLDPGAAKGAAARVNAWNDLNRCQKSRILARQFSRVPPEAFDFGLSRAFKIKARTAPMAFPVSGAGGPGISGADSPCECSSCRFLLTLECALVIDERCCGLCDSDPDSCCIYCMDEQGNRTQVGGGFPCTDCLSMFREALANCGCGGSQSGGECGTLRRAYQNLGLAYGYEPMICCNPAPLVPCFALPYRFRSDCYLDCADPPCPAGATCAMQASQASFVCPDIVYVEYNCAACCSTLQGSCSGAGANCPSGCPQGFSPRYPSQCVKTESYVLNVIPYQCKCL